MNSAVYGAVVTSIVLTFCGLSTGIQAAAQLTKSGTNTDIPHFRNTAPGVKYLGSKACAACHFAIYQQFSKTDMGNSLFTPDKVARLGWLTGPVEFSDQRQKRHYQVFPQGQKVFESEYEVDPFGKETFRHSEELAYVIGTGVNGATPIVRRGDFFFQAPISYYSATKSWDLSPNYETRDFAFSLPITSDCIGCHSGRIQPVRDREAMFEDPPVIEPAIGCERCHGPGELHVAERMSGAPPPPAGIDTAIVNPRKLPTWLADNICMNCHEGDIRVFQNGKSWDDYRPGTPLNETVFILKAPIDSRAAKSPLLEHYYSMTLSKCYRASGKLGCQSCHDPHVQPSAVEAPKYFRVKCLQCHSETSCALSIQQRIAQQLQDSCASCHMAKRPALTVSHSTLTDHRILRVASEPYPDSAFVESVAGTGFIHVNPVPGDKQSIPQVLLLKAYRKELMRGALQFKDHYFATLDSLERSGSKDAFVLSAIAQKAGSDGNLIKAIEFARQALTASPNSDSGYLLLEAFLSRTGDLVGSIDVLKQGIEAFPFSDALYQDLAARELAAGNMIQASAVIQSGLELFPENGILRAASAQLSAASDVQQAMARFGQGDTQGAIAKLKSAIAADPNNARAYDALGIVLGESGRLEDAAAEFKKAADLDPSFPDAHFHLGLAYLKSGRTADAIAEYQQALRLNPAMVEAKYGLSEICGKLGDIDGAISLQREVTRAEPDFAEAHYNLALNLWNRYKKSEALKQPRDLDQAAQELKQAAALAPRESRMFFALGQLLSDKGDLVLALTNLRKAVDLDSQNPLYHYNLGLALRQSGDLPSAVGQFRAALKISPELALAHRSLGLALRESDDLDGAATELRIAVAQLPDDPQGHHLLGTVLLKQNKIDEAIGELGKAVELGPSLTDARASLAQALQKAGRKEESQQQATELRQVNASASNLGQAMILMQTSEGQSNKKDFAAAVNTLEQAVALDPALTEAQYQLGIALAQAGDANKAIEAFREVLRRDPRRANAHLHLGLLFAECHNSASARDELRDALELAPSLVEAHLALAKLAKTEQDWPTAIRELQAALAWEPNNGRAHFDLALSLKASGRAEESEREMHISQKLSDPQRSN